MLPTSAQLVFLSFVPRVRFIFSESMKTEIRLGNSGPPGQERGVAASWRVLSDVVNALFSSDCRLCDGPLTTLNQHPVCIACAQAVRAQTGTLCTRCGEALGMESARMAASMGQTECTLCRLAPPAFTQAVAFGEYDAELRELLHLLKFAGSRATAEHFLGNHLAQAIAKLEAAATDLLIIPVPLFAARENKRGFNQAQLLASAAIKRLKKTRPGNLRLSTKALERIVDTRSLSSLNPAQRRAQVRGAFKVRDASAITGREVLLIDDIMTTGATARECSRVLLAAGAAKVWVATVAKAQPESTNFRGTDRATDVARWDLAPTERGSATDF